MRRRISCGDVGTGDTAREHKVFSIIHDYLSDYVLPSYKIPAKMQQDQIIPRKYIQIRTANIASFTSHKAGTNAALDSTIKSLEASGYLLEVDKAKLSIDYGFVGKCYRVVSLPSNYMVQGL
jgi:hypothetical protein